MPVYEYKCEEHGLFTDSKPLAQYKEPAKCPKCGKSSPKVIATPVPVSQSWRAN